MKKKEYIERYGIDAYDKMLKQSKTWREEHSEYLKEYYIENAEKKKKRTMIWRKEHPEKAKENDREHNRKDGKYYDSHLKNNEIESHKERNKIRQKDYRLYKNLITPAIEIHHEWILDTAKYRGVALVDKSKHRKGIIEIIKILKGEITLFTEIEIRNKNIKCLG